LKNPFDSALKIAIEEIIKNHSTPSRYGHFLTKEDLEKLTEEIANFLKASRDLKEKGTQILSTIDS
jgi:hypothetical protein